MILFSIEVNPHKTVNAKHVLRLVECKSSQLCTSVNNSFLLELYDKLKYVFAIPIQQIITDSQAQLDKSSKPLQQNMDDLDLKRCRQVLEQGFQIEDQHFVVVKHFLHSLDSSFLIAISKQKEGILLIKKWNENAGYLLFFLERKTLMLERHCSFQYIVQESIKQLLSCAQQLLGSNSGMIRMVK